MKKQMMLGFGLMLAAGAAMANGDFWTGDTNAVRFAANGGTVSVCSYQPNYPAVPGVLKIEWKCYDHATFGAREAVLVQLPLNGETRVIGARWAEALNGETWMPMSKD